MRRVLEVKVVLAGSFVRVAYLGAGERFRIGDLAGADLPLGVPTIELRGDREVAVDRETWAIPNTEISLQLSRVDTAPRLARGSRRQRPWWALGLAAAAHALLLRPRGSREIAVNPQQMEVELGIPQQYVAHRSPLSWCCNLREEPPEED